MPDAFALAAQRLAIAKHQREVAGDPVRWINEVLGEQLWSKQREIVQSVMDTRRTAVRSCHGAGKSYCMSRIICWWIAAHPPGDAFVVSTAPTFQQVRAILWREINRAHAKGDLVGRMSETEWKIGNELVGFGRKPADYDPTAFQGIHARKVLVVVDEGCGVPTEIFDAADTLVTNESSRIVTIGNPDDPASEFAKICQPGSGWNVIEINAFDTPNFTGEEVPDDVRELLISPTWVEEKRRKWGEDHPFWQSKILGRFPQQSANALININWLYAAARREWTVTEESPRALGVDVARFGTDDTNVALREGNHGVIVHTAHGDDTVATANNVKRLMHEHSPSVVAIDTVGVGGGVYDILANEGQPVASMTAHGRPRDVQTYANLRAEWYWHLREFFEKGEISIKLKHGDEPENDEDLLAQLAALRYKVDGRGRILLESKEEIRKRGLPSPDRADALCLAFAAPVDQDWEGVYGVMTCVSCGRGFIIEGRNACPFCNWRIPD